MTTPAHFTSDAIRQRMKLQGTDLEIGATLADGALSLEVLKSGVVVHRLVLDHATDRLENAWLADLFAREDRVRMRDLAGQVDDYVGSLDVNQG